MSGYGRLEADLARLRKRGVFAEVTLVELARQGVVAAYLWPFALPPSYSLASTSLVIVWPEASARLYPQPPLEFLVSEKLRWCGRRLRHFHDRKLPGYAALCIARVEGWDEHDGILAAVRMVSLQLAAVTEADTQ